MLLGQKIIECVVKMCNLFIGIDQCFVCCYFDWIGLDDLEIKIFEICEIINWEKLIYIKIGGVWFYYDIVLVVKVGVDVVVLDGMQGGMVVMQDVFIENVGQLMLVCICFVVKVLQDLGMYCKVQFVVLGGICIGVDVVKVLVFGVDVVVIGMVVLIVFGENDLKWVVEYEVLGIIVVVYDDWYEGKDLVGIIMQDFELMKCLDLIEVGCWLCNYLVVLMLECQIIVWVCGKSYVYNFEFEDLCVLILEVVVMVGVFLVGISWIFGQFGF